MDPRAPKAASKIGSATCPGEAAVLEILLDAGSLIDGQVALSVYELFQENHCRPRSPPELRTGATLRRSRVVT